MVIQKRIARLAFFCAILICGCDKNQRAVHKLLKTGRWEVIEMTAGTTEYTKLPKWQFGSCDDPENYCEATWEHQNGTSVKFYWKFSNLGGDFEFFPDPTESDSGSMAYAQCYNFSGPYDVKKNTSKLLWLESEKSTGYQGKLVTLRLTRD